MTAMATPNDTTIASRHTGEDADPAAGHGGQHTPGEAGPAVQRGVEVVDRDAAPGAAAIDQAALDHSAW